MIEQILKELCAGKTMIVGRYNDKYRLSKNGNLQCSIGFSRPKENDSIEFEEMWKDVPQPYQVILHIGIRQGFYSDAKFRFE